MDNQEVLNKLGKLEKAITEIREVLNTHRNNARIVESEIERIDEEIKCVYHAIDGVRNMADTRLKKLETEQ